MRHREKPFSECVASKYYSSYDNSFENKQKQCVKAAQLIAFVEKQNRIAEDKFTSQSSLL